MLKSSYFFSYVVIQMTEKDSQIYLNALVILRETDFFLVFFCFFFGFWCEFYLFERVFLIIISVIISPFS